MTTPLLFVDRDGTIIAEPADNQVDALEKVRFVRDAIPALRRFVDAGWELVMVSNQDALGTSDFPQAAFDGPQALVLQTLEACGIGFREVLIDGHRAAENHPNRKPGIGMAQHLLRDRSIDWDRSLMVGDRATDLQFAENLGVRGFLLDPALAGPGAQSLPPDTASPRTYTWPEIAHLVVDAPRRATVVRNTNETRITVSVDLDAPGPQTIHTGVGFFDHMLDQLGRHGGFALAVRCDGDLHIDEHHTVEDTGIAIGQALREAMGSKRGIARYGFTLPMDETLAQAAVDLGGRAYLVFDCPFTRENVGDLPTELVEHFWYSVCQAGAMNLNLQVRGENDHHKIEAGFKGVARALRMAIARTGSTDLPSTKGIL